MFDGFHLFFLGYSRISFRLFFQYFDIDIHEDLCLGLCLEIIAKTKGCSEIYRSVYRALGYIATLKRMSLYMVVLLYSFYLYLESPRVK